jgi:hypothetical protein
VAEALPSGHDDSPAPARTALTARVQYSLSPPDAPKLGFVAVDLDADATFADGIWVRDAWSRQPTCRHFEKREALCANVG